MSEDLDLRFELAELIERWRTYHADVEDPRYAGGIEDSRWECANELAALLGMEQLSDEWE